MFNLLGQRLFKQRLRTIDSFFRKRDDGDKLESDIPFAFTERAFSAMNLIKTRLRSKMESEFLADSMVVYIEKELAEKIDLDEII